MQNGELAALLIVLLLCGITLSSIVSEATTTTLLSTQTTSSASTSSTSATTTSMPASTSTASTTSTTTIPPLSLTSATASNAVAAQGQFELLTISVAGGAPPYTYSFQVSNTNTGNIIFSARVSNALAANSVGFTIPVEANAIGALSFTANVADSAGANAFGANIITVSSTSPTTTINATTTTINATTTTSSSSSTSTTSASTSTVPANTTTLSTTMSTTTIVPFIAGNSGSLFVNTKRFLVKPLGSPLRGLQVNLRQSNLSVSISVSNRSAPPSSFAAPPSAIYQYIQINGSVGSGRDNIDLYVKNATYNFSVPDAWLRQEGIQASSVQLFKYYPSSSSWGPLQTNLTGSNSTAYFYSAFSNSLSGYVVGFITANVVSSSNPTGLDMNSGFATYFFAFGVHQLGSPASTTYTVNDISITSDEFSKTSGPGGGRFNNITDIGYNTVPGANIVLSSSTTFNTVIAGIGANVIFANNGLTAASSTTNSLTYTVGTPNSMVVLLYASGGNTIKSVVLPTGGGCTLNQKVSLSAFAGAATANCIAATTGSFTTRIVSSQANKLGWANSIVAAVFPPYNVLLRDSPATGNIFTSSCPGCNAFNQQNGNTIQVIGTNIIAPVAPSGYSFSGFSVDSANSPNIILSPLSGTTNSITVMGPAIITATYLKNGITITSATVSNSVADQDQYETLSISISAAGTTPPYTYNFLVSNTNTGNVIFSSIQSNSLTQNAISFKLPETANDIGTLTFTANVLDSTTPTPYNALASNTFTVFNAFYPVAITSSASPAQGSPVTLNLIVAGGDPAYTYNFLVTNTFVAPVNIVFNSIVAGITATNEIATFTIPTSSQNANSVGTLTLTGNVLDSASTPNNVLITNTMTVAPPPPPTLTLTATPSTVLAGHLVQLTATVSGGTGPFNVQFYNVTGSKPIGGNVVIQSPGGSNTLFFQAGPNNGLSYTYNAIAYDQGLAQQVNSIQSTITVSGANALPEAVGWSFSSPNGMVQDPALYDTYTYNGLTFKLYGWNFTSVVANGVNSIQIVPVNALGGIPANGLLGQASTVSTATQHDLEASRLPWQLTPLGDFRWGTILWSGNVIDTGNMLMDVLQGGLLNVYYANVPSGYTIQLKSGTANVPTSLGSSIYTLGGIRIKVVTGTVGTPGTTTSVSPVANTIQFVVYNDTLFDTNSLDLLGAVNSISPPANTIPDVVVENNRFTKEKSMEVTLTNFAVTNDYIAVNPSTDTAGSGLYLLDNGVEPNGGVYFGLFVINATTQSTASKWDVPALVESINSHGMVRALHPFFGDGAFATQTFNIYGSFSTGTQTLWDVGRITQPYTISYYPSSGTTLYYFPQASDDAGYIDTPNAVNTVVTWGFQDSNHTWIETGNWIANIAITLTGKNGDSVDMGYRNWLSNLGSGTPTEYLAQNAINPVGWTVKLNPSGGYFYPSGNAGYNIGPAGTDSYFTIGRYWQGMFANIGNVIAEFQGTNEYVLGFMKNFSSGTMLAGNIFVTDAATVAYENANVPTFDNANAIFQQFNNAVPGTQTYTLNGMIDLSGGGAYTDYAWDIGWLNGAPTVFNMSNKPPTITCIPVISNTLITFPTTGSGLFAPTANAENVVDSGTAASNIIVYGTNWISTTSSASFLVGNTLWSATSSPTSAIGTQLGNLITNPSGQDTLIPLKAGGGNVIFFGLNVPPGQAAGAYNQLITIATSC
jgi:PGF-pre-PGF domain-containing protein